jgi:two-component system, chemotaxis family, chemotaxis protein CheY
MPDDYILVVDDDATTRSYLQQALEQSGYKVRTAEDGIKALSLLMQDRAKLVVSDVIMPRMDGVNLVRGMRARPELAHTPIIMLTASAQTQHFADSINLRVKHYISKPVVPDKLLAKVKQIMDELE